eukprot:5158057-Pyramimonas_sp.AAC.1
MARTTYLRYVLYTLMSTWSEVGVETLWASSLDHTTPLNTPLFSGAQHAGQRGAGARPARGASPEGRARGDDDAPLGTESDQK